MYLEVVGSKKIMLNRVASQLLNIIFRVVEMIKFHKNSLRLIK